MAAYSCSHWWHAPFYFAMSTLLAFVAVSTVMHSHQNNSTPVATTQTTRHDLALNASRALRAQGFNVMATLLQISPEIFLSTQESTIFAIQDSAFTDISVPPWVMKQLLHYHTSNSSLPLKKLLQERPGNCIPTLLFHKYITVTKTDATQRLLHINNVSVSHPDMFLDGPVSIHGVLGPFSSLELKGVDQEWDVIRSPDCEKNNSFSLNSSEAKEMVEWSRIVQLLSSNGFVSFAIGLHSVLEGIVRDYANLSSVTVFAPPNLGLMTSSSPLLEKIVRLHLLPQKLTYMELTSLPANASLATLISGRDLKVTNDFDGFSRTLTVNGVEITAPDVFSSKKFIIHGIHGAFDAEELLSS